jgi:TolB-like protein/DNA-binding SARP family transcriptional activator
MRLTLSLYGPFRAWLNDTELVVSSRRGRAILAMLALSGTGAVARDRLAATLWPDRSEEQARASLRQELSSLRRALGNGAGIVTADASSVRIDSAALSPNRGRPEDGEFLEGLDLRSEPFDDWRRAQAAQLSEAGDPGPTTDADVFANPSVLVLGFNPASDGADDIAFATGLVIDLRTSLSSWRMVPVIGPEAIGWKTDRDGDMLEMARSVGASYVIGGAIRRAGDRIRVSASLTDSDTGHLIWADTFDGKMADIFEMQEAISRAVVARVTPEIGRAEAARIQRRRPSSMTAWQLLAQTDELERTGGEGYGTPESNRAQVPLLEEAIRIEPEYARAWARLGRYHFRAAMQGWVPDRKGSIAKAVEYCEKAVSLDPEDAEGQGYLALTQIFGRYAYGPARIHGQQAVRTNPSSPMARHAFGCALEWMGEVEEALHHLRIIFRLNPNYFNRAAVLGDITICELFSGETEAAVASARQLRDLAPDYCRGLQRVVVVLAHGGHLDEAAEALARVSALLDDFDADYVRETYPYVKPEHFDMFVEGLRRAGWAG